MAFRKTFEYVYVKKADYKASVLVANYNNEEHLSQCVESILRQSYKILKL